MQDRYVTRASRLAMNNIAFKSHSDKSHPNLAVKSSMLIRIPGRSHPTNNEGLR